MEKSGFDGDRIDRFFKGEYSEQDSFYVDEVFCDNSKEMKLKHHLFKQFNEILREEELPEKDLDQILYRIHYDINSRLSAKKGWSFDYGLKWAVRIASVVMLPIVIMFGIHMYRETNLKKETWVEIKAPAWTRAQFSLPDGTMGWLNSNSSVRYNGNFLNDRTVMLNGEAFFDVFKDETRRFKVNTYDIILTVLGTRFNIASYEEENNIEVVLEEGSLIFSNEAMTTNYTMNPNDLITYDRTIKDFTTEVVDPQKYLSWTEGKLVFRNDPLDVIARRLARWYNVDVEIEGNLNNDIRLRATFLDESLDEVLSLLKRSLKIEYKIENRDIDPEDTYNQKKVKLLPGTK